MSDLTPAARQDAEQPQLPWHYQRAEQVIRSVFNWTESDSPPLEMRLILSVSDALRAVEAATQVETMEMAMGLVAKNADMPLTALQFMLHELRDRRRATGGTP